MKENKIFISYRFTGEDPKKVKLIILQIYESLKKSNYECYSTIFDSEQFAKEKWSGKRIMKKAFVEIDKSRIVLFFVNSKKISQGMLVELGYSLAKKKRIILAIPKNIVESIFRRQISEVIEYKDLKELKQKLSNIKIIKHQIK
ncbi:MAG: hypothetical protein ACP5N1_00455 [Candidatus Woesearchaeota archaeon]